MASTMEREAVREAPNPIGFDGIEFIEFATSRPQALGGFLEQMGFQLVARHRSREVELYRQGPMNLIVNAQPADVPRPAKALTTRFEEHSTSAHGKSRCARAPWSSTSRRSTALA